MNSPTQFKKIRTLALLIAPALVAIVMPTVARADAVTDWNAIASTAITAAPPAGAGQPPPVSVLHFAMVHGAVYDAVNAIDRGHQPYLVQPSSNPTDSRRRQRRSVYSWVFSRVRPGPATDLRRVHSSAPRRPAWIEDCWGCYRRGDS